MSSMSSPDFHLMPHDAPGKASVAYDHLKHSAIHGRLRPGRRLAPQDLTDFYRVSATPIRDAMVQLAIEGFIDREAGRGFAVKPFSIEDQRERLEMCFFSLSFSLETLNEPPQALLEDLAALDAGTLGEGEEAAGRLAGKVEAVFTAMASTTRNGVLNALTRVVVDQTHFVRRLDLMETGTGSVRLNASNVSLPPSRRETVRPRGKFSATSWMSGSRGCPVWSGRPTSWHRPRPFPDDVLRRIGSRVRRGRAAPGPIDDTQLVERPRCACGRALT